MTQYLKPHNAVTIFLMFMRHILYKALHRGLVSLFSMPTQRQSFCAPPHLPNKSLVWGLWHAVISVGFLGPDCIETLLPQNPSQRTCTVHVMAVITPKSPPQMWQNPVFPDSLFSGRAVGSHKTSHTRASMASNLRMVQGQTAFPYQQRPLVNRFQNRVKEKTGVSLAVVVAQSRNLTD